jgi:hypothetical protein
MQTSGSRYELIMQEVLNQKQLFEALRTENTELRRQLADLREGRGILLEILGDRFPLAVKSVDASPEVVSTVQVDPSLQEKTAMNNQAPVSSSLPETPLPKEGFTVEEVMEDEPTLVSPAMQGFLEEALHDEFSRAASRRMAMRSGPITNPPEFNEKQKETLRRELSGSFLLE